MHWFDRVAAELAAEHRVIRVDLLGHGCTSAATKLHAAAQARAMSSVLQRLGTNGATAVGHSFGADVVLAMGRRTDQVARVVIIARAPDYDCSRLPSIAFCPGRPHWPTLWGSIRPGRLPNGARWWRCRRRGERLRPRAGRGFRRVGLDAVRPAEPCPAYRSDQPDDVELSLAGEVAFGAGVLQEVLVDQRAVVSCTPVMPAVGRSTSRSGWAPPL